MFYQIINQCVLGIFMLLRVNSITPAVAETPVLEEPPVIIQESPQVNPQVVETESGEVIEIIQELTAVLEENLAEAKCFAEAEEGTEWNYLCDCKITAHYDLIKNNCQRCDEFVQTETYAFYNHAEKEYIGFTEGYCNTDWDKRCSEMDYWGDLHLLNEEYRWQGYFYHEYWFGKCVNRGVNNWRYWYEDHWIEQLLNNKQ